MCISVGNESEIGKVKVGRWGIEYCSANFLLKCQVVNSSGFLDHIGSLLQLLNSAQKQP